MAQASFFSCRSPAFVEETKAVATCRLNIELQFVATLISFGELRFGAQALLVLPGQGSGTKVVTLGVEIYEFW